MFVPFGRLALRAKDEHGRAPWLALVGLLLLRFMSSMLGGASASSADANGIHARGETRDGAGSCAEGSQDGGEEGTADGGGEDLGGQSAAYSAGAGGCGEARPRAPSRARAPNGRAEARRVARPAIFTLLAS